MLNSAGYRGGAAAGERGAGHDGRGGGGRHGPGDDAEHVRHVGQAGEEGVRLRYGMPLMTDWKCH